MSDLFLPLNSPEKIPMKNADVTLWRHVDLRPEGSELYDALKRDVVWEQRQVFIWGERRLQPRLTAWYGDRGKSYVYSGAMFDPHPWTELLLSIRNQISALTDENFNSVLLNLYRDNNDSMGLHSDDERELGPEPTIASLSLGSCRAFTFVSKDDKKNKIKIDLPSESLLLMKGNTQRFWKHGISKTTKNCEPRINLTFRTIL